MINYELFTAIENYLYKDGELTDKQLREYIRNCGELNFLFEYSRGGRNYVELETETLGKISICKKNINTFRKIISLAIRLHNVASIENKTPVETWVNFLSSCNDIKYKKIK